MDAERAAMTDRDTPDGQETVRPELIALAGTWTDEDAEAFMASIADLDQIDEGMWT